MKKPPVEFLPLDEYLKIAGKMICYYCTKVNPKCRDLQKVLLESEDAISCVAEEMMFADWRYNENKKKSRKHYRYLCGIYGVIHYLRTVGSKKNIQHSPIIYDIVDETKDLIDKEDNLKKINFLLNNSKLTQKQMFCIKEYFLNHRTYADIGKELGVERQDISIHVSHALKKMKRLTVSS